MGTGNSGKFKSTSGSLKPEHLMEELRNSGVKFTEEDVIAITKQANGKIVWLERGNIEVGLEHIVYEHGEDFNKIGIQKNKIPHFIIKAVTDGKVVGKQGKYNNKPRIVYELEYEGEIKKVAISIGANGFIVGANPR
ncbi:MAG: hypothetical protein Q4B23_01145 [Helcococcus sp.]|nr:hypothetical protein [Helcococcus sp.]